MAGYRLYANTKLCNVLFTNELARRLTNTGVTTNSLDPGVVKTDIFRNLSPTLRFIAYWVLDAMFKVINKIVVIMSILYPDYFQDSYEGAQTSIYLSVSQEVEGISGRFFRDCKEWTMPKLARDETFEKNVWEKTEELIHIKQN